MTWNQNNAYEAYLQRPAKPVEERDPFVIDGSHQGIVVSIAPYDDKQYGPSVRVVMEYTSSTSAQPGTTCAKLFNLFKQPMYPTQTSDGDDFADFVCKLQGVKLGEHHDAVKALLMTQAQGGQLELQPARGARVIFTGRSNNKPSPKTGKPYVKVSFQPCPNDLATTARNRADLDARRPLGHAIGAPAQAPQQPAPAYNAAGQTPYAGAYTAPPQGLQNFTPTHGGVQPAATLAQPAPQLPPPQGGGFGQFVAPPVSAPPAASATPPWNPAWGPKPPGYPG